MVDGPKTLQVILGVKDSGQRLCIAADAWF